MADQMEVIQEGISLSKALKSEAGEVITGSMTTTLMEILMAVLTKDMDDAECMKRIHQARGILKALGEVGGKIDQAVGFTSRLLVDRQTRKESRE